MTALTASPGPFPFTAQLAIDLAGETEEEANWELVGQTTDGKLFWEVRGGRQQIKQGNNFILDPDVPLGIPVKWDLITPRGRYNSGEVIIESPPRGWGVLSRGDGRTPVMFKWLHSFDEQVMEPRVTKHAIQGRTRPVFRRDSVAGAGGGTLPAETHGDNTSRMISTLLSNESLVLRTSGYLLDFALVEHISVDSIDFVLHEKSLARVWTLPYTLADYFAYSAAASSPVTIGEVANLDLTVGEVADRNLTIEQVARGELMA